MPVHSPETIFGTNFSLSASEPTLESALIAPLVRPEYIDHADEAAALSALATVGAERFAERPFGQLSGGERQIVLLARALATEAKVLVLDEPAASLDLANQDLLLGVLMRLRQARGHTIVFTTHHPQHGLFLADRALMMHAGDEVRYGRASEMMTDAELARLYGVPFSRHAAGPGRTDIVSPIFGAAPLSP